jgi:hypothetical protein
MEHEIWRPVTGHPGYEVSNLGAVQTSVLYDSAGRVAVESGPVTPALGGPKGKQYIQVSLRCVSPPRAKNGHRNRIARVNRKVHHIVLEAFVGPRPEGAVACHTDCDNLNNKVSNLRWDTPTGNVADTLRVKGHHYGNKTECLNGHDITNPDNVYANADGRRCKLCARARAIARERGVADYRTLL